MRPTTLGPECSIDRIMRPHTLARTRLQGPEGGTALGPATVGQDAFLIAEHLNNVLVTVFILCPRIAVIYYTILLENKIYHRRKVDKKSDEDITR